MSTKKTKKVTKKRVEKSRKTLGENFTLKNNLLTLRHWSRTFTTSLFNKKVKKYQLLCQFPVESFDLSILKDSNNALTYLNVQNHLYIARLNLVYSSVDQKLVTANFQLHGIRLKAAWDMEHATPSMMYEEIMSDKKFFVYGGKKLDNYIKPLGIARKTQETDLALRRRALEYLNFKLASDGEDVFSDADLRKLRGYK